MNAKDNQWVFLITIPFFFFWKVELKGEALNSRVVSVVIQNLKIFTDDCGIFPSFAMPG